MVHTLIDGSFLEGGGQILRNSVSLSALLSRPVSIHKIRNNRTPPGLKNQHRTGLELAAKIASAHLTGAQNKSQEINFIPGRICLPNDYSADTVTAGSITLLLQVALPLLLFSHLPVPASTLTLHGGTNASLAPQVDYTKHIFLPFIRRHFGLDGVSLHIAKRGYFPKGGGKVSLNITPLCGTQKLQGFSLMDRGKVKRIAGITHFAGLPNVVAEGIIRGTRRKLAAAGYIGGDESISAACTSDLLKENRDVPIQIIRTREPPQLTTGAGSGIVLWAELEGGGIIGGSAVGSKGVDPEITGEQAADELVRGLNEGGCIDEWLQDQIIIFMALADGKSEVRCGTGGLTLHTRTAIWLAQELTDAKFEIEDEPSGTVIIRCQGMGYTAPADTPS
ncbi:RTC domain-containing 1 [Phlegmacium glaucopus]|nr:RTC domain-containing 1 [Phlegmacium glaucopus]